MRSWILAAGAAALAMSMPALSQGQGRGGGNDKGGGQGAKAERGDRGQSAKSDRGDDNRGRDRGGEARQDRRSDRGPERMEVRQSRDDDRGRGRGRGDDAREVRVDDRSDIRVRRDDRGRDDGDIRIVTRDFDPDGDRFFRTRGLIAGCPPGLDKKDNGCMPPGQVRTLLGAPLRPAFADDMVPFAYRNWYRDNDDYYFRSGDGFIYRIDRDDNLVNGLIPLFGSGYYTMGDPWPEPYDFYNVPYQYRTYYPEGGDYHYRYGDGAIYRLDPSTNAVNAIVSLLAGDLGVGSRLPMGYNTYNVPFAYRDRYYDTPNDWYRYNDGYIYRVDPTTRLITAVIDAIV